MIFFIADAFSYSLSGSITSITASFGFYPCRLQCINLNVAYARVVLTAPDHSFPSLYGIDYNNSILLFPPFGKILCSTIVEYRLPHTYIFVEYIQLRRDIFVRYVDFSLISLQKDYNLFIVCYNIRYRRSFRSCIKDHRKIGGLIYHGNRKKRIFI